MPDKPRRREKETPRREKRCKRCGMPFAWTPDRALDWAAAKYCSAGCSGYAQGEHAAELEAAILELLAERDAGKTICPSEAAKRVGGTAERSSWEGLMEPAREAARRLARAGRIVVTQKNRVVDAATAKGPIRLRLR